MIEQGKIDALHGPSTETEPEIRNALDQVVRDSLVSITTVMALVYIVFSVFDYLYVPRHAVVPVTVANLSQMVICLVLCALLRRSNIPATWGNPIVAALALFLLLGILFTFVFTSDSQAVYMMLLIIAAGSFLLSMMWLLITVGVIFIAWAVAALQILGVDGLAQGVSFLVIGVLVSVAIHMTRFRAYRRQELALANARQELRARRAAEEALRESEDKFRRISEQAMVGIMILQEGRIRYANEACFGLSGYGKEELLALNAQQHAEMIHPDDRERVYQIFRATDQGEGDSKRQYTYRSITKSGRARWIEQWSSPITFEGAQAILIIYYDVGERKRFEEEKELLQEKLTQAERVESIGRLAGGVAHDFNNLLTPILAYSELALSTIPKEEDLYSDLAQIREAALQAKGLTTQLLAFGRKQMLKMKVLDLNELLLKDEKMLKRLIREDIRVITNLEPGLCSVMADAVQMNQILINLAVNAQDAMTEGGEIRISTRNMVVDEAFARQHPLMKPGSYVELSVEDTGHGMDQELIGRIFEPFFTTKEKGKGTGLGLATVYGIIKQHDGHIVVESEAGRGATFRIFLTRLEELPKTSSSGTYTALQASGHERILVVEDNDSVRKLVERVLLENGYRVRLADCGERALALLQASNEPVDLLLTDVVLPGMNGREIYNRINEQQPGIRVVYMSGYDDDVIADHGVLDESVQLLAKPFSVDQLTQMVRKVLES